jgi:uncharacterized protein (DUF433 family)
MAVPDPLITTSPDRLSGTPVFAGTRVPVQTLMEYIEGGDSLDDFLADFPSVSREHALAVLELAKSALLDKAVGIASREATCGLVSAARGRSYPARSRR